MSNHTRACAYDDAREVREQCEAMLLTWVDQGDECQWIRKVELRVEYSLARVALQKAVARVLEADNRGRDILAKAVSLLREDERNAAQAARDEIVEYLAECVRSARRDLVNEEASE